jgi:hypothetical protein
MNEKQEREEFDEPDDDASFEGEDVDVARLTRDLDLGRGRKARQGTPAWRRLELLAEQKRVADLTSDFEDYDIDEPGARRQQLR